MMTASTRFSLAVLLVTAASCSVHDTPAPPLLGPSELSLSVGLQAIPDSILQDGGSQAVIHVDALGGDGRPARGLGLRVDVVFEGTIQDFGTVSAKTIITAEDGKARITYTAPPKPASTPALGYNVVSIHVTPIGSDFGSHSTRTVDIRLVPPGVILPPNSPPQAQFTFSPTTPEVLSNVVFDASASTDGGSPCGIACTYAWDFGDGRTGTGVFATHQYQAPGNYQVRLTVTDTGGATGTVAQAVTVGQGGAPTAAFTFSPSNPAIGQPVFFTAEASTAGPGRHLVAWDWNFGSGATGTGETISRTYNTAGTYVVTLTVTDDAGRKSTVSQSVTVQGAAPTASFTFSPTTPDVSQPVFFNAEASRAAAGRTIVGYEWDFGDGSARGQGVSVSHTYATRATFIVTLTVIDNVGQRGTATQSVTVGLAPLEAVLTASPASGTIATSFFFDARASKGPFPIVEYRFTFGDGTTDSVGTSPTATHTYAAPGTYTARLTITDNAQRTATTTVTVTVQP